MKVCFDCKQYSYRNDTCMKDGKIATNNMECRIEKMKRLRERSLIKKSNNIIAEKETK